MNRFTKITLASVLLASWAFAAPKWIDPPRKNCTSNGGKLATGGVCEANWASAGAICSSLGARLPTIDELRKEVENCGGVIDDYSENNHNDPAYQSCYGNKGFYSYVYWSSTTYASDASKAWYVWFLHGLGNVQGKTESYYVGCVRAGQ